MTNSKNLPASDLLKQFIQDRRDIADKATPELENWVHLCRHAEEAWADLSTNLSKAYPQAQALIKERQCIPLQLQIIELQAEALDLAKRLASPDGKPSCACYEDDGIVCPLCKIDAQIEALLKEKE